MKIIGFTQKKHDKLERHSLAANETAEINQSMGVPAVLYRRGTEARLIPLSEIAEIELDPSSIVATRGGSAVAL